MTTIIGIRREDKNRWERRAPLTPKDMEQLISEHGLRFHVQPSNTPPIRVFPDQAYKDAGAEIREDLYECDLILGVKEMPADFFREKKAFMFFSHTTKCQPFNMAMLKKLLDMGCTLFDYELITDEKGRRKVFFGRHAGLAGMIDTLAALGRRLDEEGIPSPFSGIRMAHEYSGLSQAQADILEAGEKLNALGLDPRITPLVVGFAGYGHVSSGAQEILNLMPTLSVTPDDIPALRDRRDLSSHHIYSVVFKEEDMVAPKDPADQFMLQDYYDHPEKYVSIFDRYTPHLNVLMNCIFWTEKYPRLITTDALRDLFGEGQQPYLRVVGDISCDIKGSIEFTLKATNQDVPCFVYEPSTGKPRDGFAGNGPVVMAVDNLPCELPLEATEYFSRTLREFIAEFAKIDLASPGALMELSDPLKKSLIAYQGCLMSPFKYIEECIQKEVVEQE
ncbi:MAG: hypothetical protein KAY24_10450 [Candidatus Eisenbacteria sp.]|nr:hypothetical protein [Candidatus Eisenbacteria bacterium]